MRRSLCFLSLLLFPALSAHSQSSAPSIVIQAVHVNEPMDIDGNLSERVWQHQGYSAFFQREPHEGKPASERTEVIIAYDEDALYVGARLFDSSPDSIMQTLGRRDVFVTADWFGIYIDPYYDRRSGYFFGVSAGGTIIDGVLYNDDWDDETWDGVWEGEAKVNGDGWTVEMRIPFSQLRFHHEDQYRWGVNFRRDIGRKNEISYVVYTPLKESGFVSRFPDLVGMSDIMPSNQVEILPYVNTKAEYLNTAPGDPFNDGSRFLAGGGIDMKVGLGSNLTLDGTVNPDFGQVEVDPAVINLSDVETFYPEKRPFFVEGATIYEFGYGGASSNWGFNWSSPSIFYSRRIGKAPSGSLPDHDYADVPAGTRIIGAAKVTGKLEGNWNIGTAHALTARESARIYSSGTSTKAEVEPLAYYGIARAQKEFNEGRQAIGGIATLTSRKLNGSRLQDEMNSEALVGGLDGWTFLDDDKTWVVTGWAAATHVRGSQERILSLQQSSQHYYQRPDASHVSVDSTATSLSGFAGRFALNKQKGNIIANAAFGVVSPGFDVNDLGFQWRTDFLNMHVGGGYQWTEPGSIFRRAEVMTALFQNYDFGGNLVWRGVWARGWGEFHNFWGVNVHFAYNPHTYDNRRTRGGPVMLTLPGREYGVSLYTDSRKKLSFDVGFFSYHRTDEPSYEFDLGLEWRPTPALTFRFSPWLSLDRTRAQWVANVEDSYATATYGSRYVFAVIDQTTLAASIRLNWTFTPQLSLQLYAQPLIASGDYYQFKELSRPRTFDFLMYGEGGSTITEQRDANGALVSYEIDPDGGGPASPFVIDNPNFNIRSLRGSAVLRWEFRRGSVIYFVWTQNRSDYENTGDFRFRQSMSRLIDAKADNIFMIKMSYWFSL